MQGPFGVYNATPPALGDKDQAQLQLNPDGSLKVGGAGHGLIVSGQTPLVTAQMVRPGNATQYSIGDAIANSMTAASVVPIEFSVASMTNGSGRIMGGRCVVTAASGTIVLPNFDLLLFRPATNIPFAAGGYIADNSALNISAAAMVELVGVLSFVDSGWRNQAGGATAAGAQVWQTASFINRPYASFNLAGMSSLKLLGLLQAQNAWNPGNVANTFDFALDVDAD